MKLITSVLVLLLGLSSLFSEDSNYKGIHQEQSEYYKDHQPQLDNSIGGKKSQSPGLLSKTSKYVIGYHPYWASSEDYLAYDYEALNTIAYFSYEVDIATGSYKTIRGWDQTPLIEYAHDRGTKVVLCVTNFGSANNAALLSSPDKQETLINTLIDLLKQRNGDGVDIDFESVSSAQRDQLSLFFKNLHDEMKAELPDAIISAALPAVDWADAFDLAEISKYCDYLMIMGYNYYYSGSSKAGPVAPLDGGSYNVSKSVEHYLNYGVPPEKLVLGLPWYGLEWPVEDTVKNSNTTGKGRAIFLRDMEAKTEGLPVYFDDVAQSPWFNKEYGAILYQAWSESSAGLMKKYEHIVNSGIAGLGIWALSYQDETNQSFDDIKSVFGVEHIIDADSPDSKNDNNIAVMRHQGLKLMIPVTKSGKLRLVDLMGKEVLEQGFTGPEISIATEGFVPGIYRLILESEGKYIFMNILVY